MSMKLSLNMSAIIASNQLAENDSKLAESMERLSSGLKINHAKDNPSGLAIAKRMNAQIKGLELAERNAQDGISVIETAEGALGEIHDILQRMNELAVQAANGSNDDNQRQYLQDEVDALNEEITRIAKDTAFNGQGLLDGSYDLKAYTDNLDVDCTYYSDEVKCKEYGVTITSIITDADGVITDATVDLSQVEPNNFPADAKAVFENGKVVITASDGFEMKLELDPDVELNKEVVIDATGIGAMRMQVGSNEGQVLAIRIPEISTDNIGCGNIDLTTAESAQLSITMIEQGIEFVSSVRSELGAYQNRLEYTTANLSATTENMTSAYSRIMDVDMATEMTEYTKYQVMTQAATSMLAQANERPQQVLQLLQ